MAEVAQGAASAEAGEIAVAQQVASEVPQLCLCHGDALCLTLESFVPFLRKETTGSCWHPRACVLTKRQTMPADRIYTASTQQQLGEPRTGPCLSPLKGKSGSAFPLDCHPL